MGGGPAWPQEGRAPDGAGGRAQAGGAPSAATAAVETRRLVRRYGSVTALDGVDLVVPADSIYAVVGPNGAGKTTLLSILTTLALPTAGQARVFGFDVVTQAHRVRSLLGVAFQEASLDLDLPGWAVLEFHARLYGLAARARRQRVAEVAEAVGLAGALHRRVGTYSGGMKRRLELARALLGGPRLLVLDEPTAQLDPHSREAIWELIRRLRQQASVTVLFTTHYLEEAERLADRVAILDRGRVLAEGPPAELVQRLGEEVVYVRGEGPMERIGQTLQQQGVARWWATDGVLPAGLLQAGVSSSARALALVVEAAREHQVVLRELSVSRPSLHDVFMRLTGRRPEG